MFEYCYSLVGNEVIVKEFDIADATAISKGELVRITAGKVVAGGSDYTTPYAGVTAESKAANDGVTRIKLYCSPFAIFAVSPIRTIVSATPSATVWTDSVRLLNTTADKANGGYLKIKEKAVSATGTFSVNDIIAITDSATNTLTGVFAGNTTVGDKADLYPPVGDVGVTASATNALTLTWAATSGTALEVVGHDFDREKVHVMIKLHQFSN
jgi:hypothetical protein